jgi:hypothetical protein
LEEGNWTLEGEEGWLDGGEGARGLGRRRLNEAWRSEENSMEHLRELGEDLDTHLYRGSCRNVEPRGSN